ncbi:MAG: aspartyl protease family protein [Planctomycetales bacterium]|nr:aspartyl protease family protein [Planctomycetales bacterium]
MSSKKLIRTSEVLSRCTFVAAALPLLLTRCWAQEPLPVIRATARQVTIQDGNARLENVWSLSPETEIDTYYVNQPRRGDTVTFSTDLASISFKTAYGESYEFIVLLNEKKCHIRISAKYAGVYTPERIAESTGRTADTIPFEMRGSRIYLTGKVNGNDNISMQLDLGAGAQCVNETSAIKAGVKFDGTIPVTNSDGTNNQPRSLKNTIEIGNLRWKGVPLVQVGNMDRHEDLIVGNSLFETKIVEIDYDRQVLVVRDSLDNRPDGFSMHDIILKQHRPMIQAAYTVEGEEYTDWFLFDTGRDGTMMLRDDVVRRHDLWNKLSTLMPLGSKKVVCLDRVSLGGISFDSVVTNAINPANSNGGDSLLGNELLNHFNVVFDFPNGVAYLKPNSLPNKSYSNYAVFFRDLTLLVSAGLIGIVGLWAVVRKLRNRNRRTIKTRTQAE